MTVWFGDFPLIWRERAQAWVGVFGEDHAVHIRHNGKDWSAHEPYALRAYASGPTLKACAAAALSCFESKRSARAAQIQERLNENK